MQGLAAALAPGFVLTPPNLTSAGLSGALGCQPGLTCRSARRWHVPLDAASSEGLGGGLAFVVESQLCAKLLPTFREALVDCHGIESAIRRAMRVWSDNHPTVVKFRNITGSTAACTALSSMDVLSTACPWELYVGAADGAAYPGLAAYVVNYGSRQLVGDESARWWEETVRSPSGVSVAGVEAIRRSELRIQTHVCYYLDTTFCHAFHRNPAGHVVIPLVCFLVFGLAMICVCGLAVRLLAATTCRASSKVAPDGPRGSATAGAMPPALEVLTRVSPLGALLVVYCVCFPLAFYSYIYLVSSLN